MLHEYCLEIFGSHSRCPSLAAELGAVVQTIEQLYQESLEGAGEYTESTFDFQTRIATR